MPLRYFNTLFGIDKESRSTRSRCGRDHFFMDFLVEGRDCFFITLGHLKKCICFTTYVIPATAGI